MKIPKSTSGMFRVTLSKPHEHAGFLYKPGAGKTVVNREILDAMIADDAVTNVAAA